MPSKVAPSIIHAITCLSLHPSIQTMKTKATKAKLVGPHERLGRCTWLHEITIGSCHGGKRAHACLLTLKPLGQKLAGRYFEPKSGALPGPAGREHTAMERSWNLFPEPVSEFQNDRVSGPRLPQVWRHPYEAVGSLQGRAPTSHRKQQNS